MRRANIRTPSVILRRIAAAALGLAVLAAGPPAAAGAGEKMYKEFVEKNVIYADERWQRYVREIGARLLAQTSDAGRQYHFHVLDSDQVNAFATADAYIFVSRGLLAFMQSEDQLAAVIGHEIGHVVGRHMRKRRVTNITGKSVGWIAALATGRGELMRDVTEPLTALLVAGYGREMELEADRFGGEYLARAGYNPESVIDAVWVLKDQATFSQQTGQEPITYHGLSRSHPREDRRLHQAIGHARGLAPEELAEPVGEFWELMDGLAYGDDAAEGLVKEHAFYHAGMRLVIDFPEGWSVRTPKRQVVARAPGGKDEASITFSLQASVKRKSPERYVSDVLERDDVTSGESLEINEMPAYIGEIDSAGAEAQLQLIAVLYRGREVFLFRGECGPDGDPDAFRAAFRATLEGVRLMTPEDIRIANSRSIAVIVAQPGQTYAELAQSSSLREFAEETLRLLNADYPNGEPTPGDYIKVVR